MSLPLPYAPKSTVGMPQDEGAYTGLSVALTAFADRPSPAFDCHDARLLFASFDIVVSSAASSQNMAFCVMKFTASISACTEATEAIAINVKQTDLIVFI